MKKHKLPFAFMLTAAKVLLFGLAGVGLMAAVGLLQDWLLGRF